MTSNPVLDPHLRPILNLQSASVFKQIPPVPRSSSPLWPVDPLTDWKQPGDRCTVMFSGGRDSTIAILRLAPYFDALDLITVSSDHLVGIERLHRRLVELERLEHTSICWTNLRQLTTPFDGNALASYTCLPCQKNYLTAAVVRAAQNGANSVAAGYAGYQSDWPEQTPQAVSLFKRLLERRGIRFLLPVYDLESKAKAKEVLTQHGFNSESLEQKCLKQITNRALTDTELEGQLAKLESSLNFALDRAGGAELEILDQRMISG